MSTYIQGVGANASQSIPIDSVGVDFGYTGSNITSMTVVYQGITYVKTVTYSGNNVTSISPWVAQ